MATGPILGAVDGMKPGSWMSKTGRGRPARHLLSLAAGGVFLLVLSASVASAEDATAAPSASPTSAEIRMPGSGSGVPELRMPPQEVNYDLLLKSGLKGTGIAGKVVEAANADAAAQLPRTKAGRRAAEELLKDGARGSSFARFAKQAGYVMDYVDIANTIVDQGWKVGATRTANKALNKWIAYQLCYATAPTGALPALGVCLAGEAGMAIGGALNGVKLGDKTVFAHVNDAYFGLWEAAYLDRYNLMEAERMGQEAAKRQQKKPKRRVLTQPAASSLPDAPRRNRTETSRPAPHPTTPISETNEAGISGTCVVLGTC